MTTDRAGRDQEFRQSCAAGNRDFVGYDLSGADLEGADLRGFNLSRVDFDRANLERAQLSGADLTSARLLQTKLSGANLVEANLFAAFLLGTDLHDADLSRANLRFANLTLTNLRGANLAHANLLDAHLRQAELVDTTLTGVSLQNTSFVKLDLTCFCREEKIQPKGECFFDFRSILKSVAEPRLPLFLHAAGMPVLAVKHLIEAALTFDPEKDFSLLYRAFISYGGPDEPFAIKLRDALRGQGVNTFLFKDDALPGQKLHHVMRNGVEDYDKTILICSATGLQRPGLLNELDQALAREAREGGGERLIPVVLDDYLRSGWQPNNANLAKTVRDRVSGDFRNHEDPSRFKAEVSKLIQALKKREE